MTRDRILEVAGEAFLEASYQKASIDQIAKRAGVSKGAIFHYFDSKFDLAQAAMFHFIEHAWTGPFQQLESMPSAHEKLALIIDFSIDFMLDNPNLMTVFIEIYKEGVEKNKRMEKWIKFFHEFWGAIGALFEACSIPNPVIKAHLLIGCLDALGMEALLAGQFGIEFDREVFKREVYEIFVGNYVKGSGREGN